MPEAVTPLSESQGDDAGPTHVRRSRGLHLSLGGPAVVRRNSNFQAMLETFSRQAKAAAAAATEVYHDGAGAVDQSRHVPARGLRNRTGKGKRITKRQCKKQLMECQASLGACLEEEAKSIFLQMAESCTLKKVGNKRILSTIDMDVDTYSFYDRPYRYDANNMTTFFNGYLFNRLFAGSPAVAAVTFNVADGEAKATFEGPLVSVLLKATSMQLQADNTTLLIEYEIDQSAEQEAGMSLSRLFPGDNLDGSDVLSYEHCTLFIDSARDAFLVNSPTTRSDSFRESIFTLPSSIQLMERASTVVEAGPAGPWLQRYARVWQINGKGGVESRDYLRGAAETIRSITSFINNCNANCDARAIVDGISGLFYGASFRNRRRLFPCGYCHVCHRSTRQPRFGNMVRAHSGPLPSRYDDNTENDSGCR